jgi:uncharacterized protein YeaC (DUF1315 family)
VGKITFLRVRDKQATENGKVSDGVTLSQPVKDNIIRTTHFQAEIAHLE